jgi:GNAT superfamily N-acetyltransferase
MKMGQYYEASVAGLRIRIAEEDDAPAIYEMIMGLAEYENMTDVMVASEELLKENLFRKKQAEAIIAEYKGEPVGYALFFYTFSTFVGKANLFLEDLYLKPEARGRGIGKALLACLARITVERGCDRLEWMVLDWNEPSIKFYKQLGAKPLDEWTTYRVDGEALPALAAML